MKILILFPSDFFDLTKVDIDYEEEFKTVIQFKEFVKVIFNYDEFISDRKLKLFPEPNEECLCIYRGWMLKPEYYRKLYNALKNKNIRLINTPMEYEQCHLFPNSYTHIEKYTPETKWFESIEDVDLNLIRKCFDKFMIKDYVKSVKGTDFPKYFDNTISDEDMQKYLKRFIELRGELYVGGIVFKQYVELKKYNNTTNEYRVFYCNGKIVTISRNSNQIELCPYISTEFVQQFCNLKSNFYTVDFAELNNGDWVIIETGDGQVSGLSPNQYTFQFYAELKQILCFM